MLPPPPSGGFFFSPPRGGAGGGFPCAEQTRCHPSQLRRGAVIFRDMFRRTDDLRITQVRPLIPPAILLEEIPISERASNIVSDTRLAIANVLDGLDPRLVVIVGPCSIHDTKAALEYAERLQPLAHATPMSSSW